MKDDSSLLYACAIDDIGLIEERVAHATPAQLKKSNQEYGTPLHAAALNGDKQAVDLLVAAGADCEAGNFVHNNAMLACVEAGKLDMARYLIDKGSNPTRKGVQNRNALSQLILYCWDRDFAEYLVGLGLDVNQTSIDKQSLLSDAASTNNADAIDFLLDHGIDRNYFNSALCWGIIRNAPRAVELLLDKGGDLDKMYPTLKGIEKGVYHLIMTKENAHDMIRLLVNQGVDFTKTPQRQVVVGIDSTKLSPVEYAKEYFQKFPGRTCIPGNLAIVEGR